MYFKKIETGGHKLVLGLVGLIDAKGINVTQPIMAVRLSDVSSKKG